MQKKWIIKERNEELCARLCAQLELHPLLSVLLLNRGISDPDAARRFLKPELSGLFPSGDLPDIDKAVGRIRLAVERREPVLICGDYDVDGITASVVLNRALSAMGADVEYYLPNRITEGYGISHEAVNTAVSKKKGLVISVDCGISDFEEIKALKDNNIDTIVIDHHLPHDDALPLACAIVNPKIAHSKYPFKDLAAVGVVFKVAQMLLGSSLKEELDLVALGTVADVVPLLDENRIIVREGLRRLSSGSRHGIKALIDVARMGQREITCGSISYILGPRINAGGRMGDADAPLRLLLSENAVEAELLAKTLDRHNRSRQNIEEKILNEAVCRLESGEFDLEKDKIIVLENHGWHKGVLGIVAAKISDRYNRPAVIISCDGDKGSGSCRSIRQFHILEALSSCRDHLMAYGGHKYAAGLTIDTKNIPEFRDSMRQAAERMLQSADLTPVLEIESMLRFSELSTELVESIEDMAPFGCSNPEPVFCATSLRLKGEPRVLARGTLKVWVTDGERTFSAVGFGMASLKDYLSEVGLFDAAFKVSIDRWNGRNAVQLELKDVRKTIQAGDNCSSRPGSQCL